MLALTTGILAFVVVTLVFLLLRLIPGDPAVAALGENASQEQLEIARQRMGNMVSTARGYMFNAPLMLLWPSIVLALLVMGFNLTVDGLRDALDPRLSSGRK